VHRANDSGALDDRVISERFGRDHRRRPRNRVVVRRRTGSFILPRSSSQGIVSNRYLLTCEALATTQKKFAFTVFERTFKDFGLPRVIRTDNGVPFASAHALYGLSKLSVWWLTKPAAPNVLQQQARFDGFVTRYNHERPHQALGMRVPADLYVRSPRLYRGLEDLTYPFHDRTVTVTRCGRVCFNRRKINLSQVFAGQNVGVTQVGDRIWLVTFMDYDLGYFDDETCRLEPIDNPFGPKVLPMSPE